MTTSGVMYEYLPGMLRSHKKKCDLRYLVFELNTPDTTLSVSIFFLRDCPTMHYYLVNYFVMTCRYAN